MQEAALTGESAPTAKGVPALADADAGAGDRHDMVFMGTEVTRGRGVLVVTATGTTTQIGRVADLLGTAGRETTPLQRQIGSPRPPDPLIGERTDSRSAEPSNGCRYGRSSGGQRGIRRVARQSREPSFTGPGVHYRPSAVPPAVVPPAVVMPAVVMPAWSCRRRG